MIFFPLTASGHLELWMQGYQRSYGRWCELCHDDELSTTSDSMEKCCSLVEEGDGASQQQTMGGWGNRVGWITWFVRLCWFDGTHRRWINRYMLCNSEESYSLQVLIVSWDVRGEDFWIPEVLKQWQTTSMSSGVCFGRIRILAIFDSALLCCTTGNDMEWLYLLWQPKMPCDLVISGGNTNIQEILRLIM